MISKVDNPLGLNDIGTYIFGIYKVIIKVLAKKMKGVLKAIIDERQCAFIGGCNMLHGVLVANKVVEDTRRRIRGCLVFKVDFEKAYDSISWSFLYYMLRRLWFCETWNKWVKGCLEFVTISVLVNENPTE